MQYSSMVDLRAPLHPVILYRPIRPSDLEVLEKIHSDLFPIRYEPEFFSNVVNSHDIVSWGVVDRSRRDGLSDELIGFVTARIVPAKDNEIEDLLRFDSAKSDQTLVYILTLGVVDYYRNLGIASSLIQEVIKYASSIPTCRAVYLHVISYNNPAIYLYQKMSFQCVRRLHGFYFINGQHYDSFLFIYYINGGRSPCSPLELVTVMATYVRSGLKLATAKLWKNNEGKQVYIVVGNPEEECPGSCAVPFHSSRILGMPVALTLEPPSGSIGADAMAIHFASALAETVTNPFGTGFFGGKTDHEYQVARVCMGLFATGAFPGYPGNVRVDPLTGGAFNAHGLNSSKFLLPALWDAKTDYCWTVL